MGSTIPGPQGSFFAALSENDKNHVGVLYCAEEFGLVVVFVYIFIATSEKTWYAVK